MNSTPTKKRNFKHQFFAIRSEVNKMLNEGYTKDYIYNHFLAKEMMTVGYKQFVKYTLAYCPAAPSISSKKNPVSNTVMAVPSLPTHSQPVKTTITPEVNKPKNIFDGISKRPRTECDYDSEQRIKQVYEMNKRIK